MFKKINLITFIVIIMALLTACTEDKEIFVGDGEPFWNGNIMKNESVLLIEEDGVATGKLMFNPTKIISVKNSSLSVNYIDGIDYILNGNTIIKKEDSSIPSIKKEVLYGINMPSNQGLSTQPASSFAIEKGYSNVLYTESPFLFKNQIFITYEYDNSIDFDKQEYLGDQLPNTLNKLKNKEELNIIVYGDSISTGSNASGSSLQSVYDDPNSQYISWQIPPFGLSFPELFAEELSYKYKTNINLLSASKGGTTSEWGRINAVGRALNPDYGYDPDLVLIHFGTNDSSLFIADEVFKNNIKSIIENIRASSTKTVEFILIGAMETNKDAIQYGRGTNYIKELTELSNEYDGIITVNVGLVHQMFLKEKSYWDMSANGINHPNDFLHRIYAMVLNAALMED